MTPRPTNIATHSRASRVSADAENGNAVKAVGKNRAPRTSKTKVPTMAPARPARLVSKSRIDRSPNRPMPNASPALKPAPPHNPR